MTFKVSFTYSILWFYLSQRDYGLKCNSIFICNTLLIIPELKKAWILSLINISYLIDFKNIQRVLPYYNIFKIWQLKF